MHNKFPEISGNFPLILHFWKIYNPSNDVIVVFYLLIGGIAMHEL